MSLSREVALNFRHSMIDDNGRTVEFRRFEGSNSFAVILYQITFTLCFVYRCLYVEEQGFDNTGVFKNQLSVSDLMLTMLSLDSPEFDG